MVFPDPGRQLTVLLLRFSNTMLNYKSIFYKALPVFLYLFLIMGCQSDPQPAQDAKLPPEKAPINKTQKSAKVINPARLSAKILLAKTEYLKLKKDCERLWKLFDKRRDPESWVALVATIQLNSSGAPCRDFLKTNIENRFISFCFITIQKHTITAIELDIFSCPQDISIEEVSIFFEVAVDFNSLYIPVRSLYYCSSMSLLQS